MWKHMKTCAEGNCDLFGVNIFDYPWEYTGVEISVLDPIYKQKHKMFVYKIRVGDEQFTFAAGEFSNGVYGVHIDVQKNRMFKCHHKKR